jgi:hypothetical protein
MAALMMRTSRRYLYPGLLLVLAALFLAPLAVAQNAVSLQARQSSLRDALANSPFDRPLLLESTQVGGTLKGEVYAAVAQPFEVVGHAFQGTDHWCDILILHLNVKNCRARGAAPDLVLSVAIGRKFDQPIEQAYQVDFSYRVSANEPGYMAVTLGADQGPLGTKDYRIMIEAVPLDGRTSFIHMSYSYAYGMAARTAMQVYLATLGRGKIGFSIVNRQPDGTPVYVDNVRGVVERNTMRYYLAIESYLGAYGVPPAQRVEKRLRDWFAANERYPLQLHELERDEYLEMKRRELARQNEVSTSAN